MRLKARRGLIQQEIRTHIYYRPETVTGQRETNTHKEGLCYSGHLYLIFICYFPDIVLCECENGVGWCVCGQWEGRHEELMVHMNNGKHISALNCSILCRREVTA